MAVSRSEDNSFPSLRRQKRTPKWGILAAVIVLLATGLWSANYANRNKAQISMGERLRHDFEAVWSWSGGEYAGGAERANWTFRWDSGSDRKGVERIAASLGFTLSTSIDEAEPVDIMASNDAAHMKLWIHSGPATEQVEGQPFELVLLFDASAGTGRATIMEEISKVERATEGLIVQGGFTVRGMAIHSGSAARIAALASAKEKESYNDGHTESRTYFSEALQSSVQSGSTSVNLQLADSAAVNGGSRELIIGVPLITGDYSQ